MSETNPPEQAPGEGPVGGDEEDSSDAEPLPGQDVLCDEDLADAQAHCPHCLEPITSADYYCPKCTKPVGQLTGILPLINVPFQAQFFGGMWRRLWYEDVGWAQKTLCAILCSFFLVVFWPVVLIVGLPIVSWKRLVAKLRKRKEGRA